MTRMLHLRLAALVVLAFGAVARAQQDRWVETHSWSGTGTKQTEMFWTAGAQWRLRYSPKGSGMFQIGVYDADGRLLDIAASLRPPTRGRANFRDRGRHYLAITGVDVQWTVRVEQFLTVIEEWHLTQLMQREAAAEPSLVKLGVWTGNDGDETYHFTVPHGSWKVRHSNTDGGLLQIVIRDAGGFVALAANTDHAGEDQSWVHRAGAFIMDVKSSGTSWRVEVLVAPATLELPPPTMSGEPQ